MRAIKIVCSLGLCLFFLPALATETLTCLSNNNNFTRCDLSQADQRDIRIKQIKGGDCNLDNSWGVDGNGIWVDKGCGAVFEYSDVAPSGNEEGGDTSVIIAPGFTGPYYGPGFYYGAGYYENNNWNNNEYCNNNNCNHNQQHNNNYNNNNYHQEENRVDDEFHGGGEGGFHGGGGGRR